MLLEGLPIGSSGDLREAYAMSSKADIRAYPL